MLQEMQEIVTHNLSYLLNLIILNWLPGNFAAVPSKSNDIDNIDNSETIQPLQISEITIISELAT